MNEKEHWNISVEIADILTNLLISGGKETFITYGDLAVKVKNPSVTARSVSPFLGDLSSYCVKNGYPAISAIVVGREDGFPGKGYFPEFIGLPKSNKKALEKYNEQLKKVWAFDWSKLRKSLSL